MLSNAPIKHIAVAMAFAGAMLLCVFPLDGYPAQFSYSAAVILITLVGWSMSLVPPFLTALIFFALSVILNLLDPILLFAGFGSTAVWLIISGFVIGSAIASSGLGNTLASFIAPHLTGSYVRLISGLVISAVLLGFIMPSSIGRAVVLIPIGLALAEQVGFAKGSNGRLGVVTALTLACNMPSFAVLPANIPNMVFSGASETLFGIRFGYTEYLLLHFPVLGILKSIAIVAITLFVFPAKVNNVASDNTSLLQEEDKAKDKAQKSIQKRVGVILAITLLLWVTDSVHGVSPAWVGLVTSIILLMPRLGCVPAKSFNNSVDFGTIVFVASALGLGVLVNESGIGAFLGKFFSGLLPGDTAGSFLNFMALSIIATLTGVIATVPGVPTVLTPLATDLVNATGLSLPAVLMTQVVGFSTIIFPYQVAPLILAMQMSKEPIGKLLKISLPLALVTVVFLMPLDYLWWVILGWI
ncbi:SLC13 family permease [Marinomonas algarum]|uniref:Anion permease n=1 Tax=Marinomonas algarum TaxID=2883105 RepID=A0A9X1RW05_9GAMM|nr:SLC13 family permease [Marinomonas algarum]MCB5163087.1 anion permease [Marinomonas algarum]